MVTCISNSPEETIDLGYEWGRLAGAGWLVGLRGELGAGKTQLVKGLARGLGIPARVHSPTFSLIHPYDGGRLPLYHIDLYRLAVPEDVIEAGLEDYLWNPPGITVVEWIERGLGDPPWAADRIPRPPAGFRHVVLQISGENSRQIQYEDFGA